MSIKIKSVQQGFTLIEVMVALLIIAVGMLGVAGMQTMGMQSGGLAAQRLSVIMKAQEIAERIRVNSSSIASYNIGDAETGTNNACFNSTSCTAAELAEYDIYLWKQDLKTVLPNNANTTASVIVSNPNPDTKPAVVTITISWDSAVGSQSYTTTFQVDSTNNVLD